MKLGWAYGRVMSRNAASGPVLIGKDTRISGYMFESALEAGLSAAGVDIRLLGPMPTPAISFLTKNTRARGGIVISASHNPYYDNGIKFFTADGAKLPDELELEIERELEQPLISVQPRHLGKAVRMNDAPRRYIEFCKSRIHPDISFRGMNIVIDCAHGAAYHIAPRAFEELGANITTMGNKPDGLNINEGCGATQPGALRDCVLASRSDLGIALDGDGDRLIMVDARGEVVDGDELLHIIARNKHASINGGVVGTMMSNLGLEKAILALGLNFFRAKVGDRYVLEMLMEKKLKLGGESSGHIINLNLTSTGDGIISALQVLEIMVTAGKPLHELKQGMEKFPQKLMNVRLKSGVNLSDYPELVRAARAAEAEMKGSGRVLLRPSGTEPLMRIMVEGSDAGQVEIVTRELVRRVEATLRDQVVREP
jgi:phosphoglucosamine mutase